VAPAAKCGSAESKRAADEFGKLEKCVVAAEEHAKRARMHQKRADHVLLVPAAVFAEHPFLWIFGGQEDVVDVDAHAAAQAREDFEDEVIDVAAGLGDVRGIDEEHVTGFELVELDRVHVLHLRLDDARDAVDALFQELARIRLDAGEVERIAEEAPIDVGNQQARIARADFDHAARLPFVQEREKHARIEPAELAVAREEAIERRRFLKHLRIVVPRQMARQRVLEDVSMALAPEIEAEAFGLCGPQTIGAQRDVERVDHRRVEMSVRERRLDDGIFDDGFVHGMDSVSTSMDRTRNSVDFGRRNMFLRHRIDEHEFHPRRRPWARSILALRLAGRPGLQIASDWFDPDFGTR